VPVTRAGPRDVVMLVVGGEGCAAADVIIRTVVIRDMI
jgi:hypothetical protein